MTPNHHLKRIRKQKGLSQQELAQQIAMEQTTYSRKERGLSPISEREWACISEALNVPVAVLKNGTEVPQTNDSVVTHINTEGITMVKLPENMLHVILTYNQKLEQENAFLKQQLNLE